MRGATIAVVVAAMVGTGNASAQTPNSDIQAWPSATVTASVGGRLEIRADGILQVTNEVSRVGRELLRVVVIGEVNDRLALGGGYTWTRVEGPGGIESSNIGCATGRPLPSRLGGRERSLVADTAGGAASGARGRNGVPIARADQARRSLRGAWSEGVVWSEYFHSINRTDWSGESGPALVLTFVGVHIPVSKRTTIEPGYLNQMNFIVGRNQARHVVAVFFAMRLSHS